jgi:hypothetical protein
VKDFAMEFYAQKIVNKQELAMFKIAKTLHHQVAIYGIIGHHGAAAPRHAEKEFKLELVNAYQEIIAPLSNQRLMKNDVFLALVPHGPHGVNGREEHVIAAQLLNFDLVFVNAELISLLALKVNQLMLKNVAVVINWM